MLNFSPAKPSNINLLSCKYSGKLYPTVCFLRKGNLDLQNEDFESNLINPKPKIF